MANRITSASIKRALEARHAQPAQAPIQRPAFDPNALISARILQRVREGSDVCAAFDDVCGEGAFARLASDLYDRLRSPGAGL